MASGACCDLCYQDGQLKLAIARYTDKSYTTRYVCDKHVEDVKKAKLPYARLDQADMIEDQDSEDL